MSPPTDPSHDDLSPSFQLAGPSWGFVLRIAVTGALVLYLADQIDWAEMVHSLGQVGWSYWFAALGVYLVAQTISSVRWGGLARAVALGASHGQFLQLYFEGMFFSLCLPTSVGGDVVKAYRLAPTLATRVLAGCTVLADRLTGLTALLSIATVAIIGQSLAAGLVSWIAVIVLVGAAVAFLTRAGLVLAQQHAARLTLLPRVGRLIGALQPYFDRPPVIAAALAWSLAIQALNIVCVWTLGQALGLEIPASAYCVAVPIVSLLTVLPLSINGVGIREGGLALLLAGYGMTHEAGIALGLLWFLVVMASGLIGGAVYLLGPVRPRIPGPPAAESPPEPVAATPAPTTVEPARAVAAQELLRLQVHAAHRRAERFATHTLFPGRATARTPQSRNGVMDLSVVVPIYNERENIRRLYDALQAVLVPMGCNYEMVLVDDGSTDGSSEQLQALAEHDPTVKIVLFRRNYGQTAAMHAGIQMATGDVIVTMDADLQNDPSDIPMLLARLNEGYDLIHGWRRHRQDGLVLRKIPSKIANWLISRVTRFPVHDLGCTLKAMRREIAQELQLYGEMHRFIPILAAWRGARCLEVETKHHPRRYGQSKYGISRTLRVVLDLITVKYLISYLSSPMRLFGGIGMASTGLAIASGAATIGMKIGMGQDMTDNPLLLLSTLLIMVSLQFFVLGMLGEVGVRTYYESQGAQPYAIRELINFEPEAGLGADAPPARGGRYAPPRRTLRYARRAA
ncbi:MAG: glycosyltransferase [Pirellulales bacterium]|nr:glycosyltransferase [Pirellulales bacterium]